MPVAVSVVPIMTPKPTSMAPGPATVAVEPREYIATELGDPAIREALTARFKQRTQAEWAEVFDGTDACVAAVVPLSEAPRHPHLAARGTFVERDGITQPAPAPRSTSIRTPGDAAAQGGHHPNGRATYGHSIIIDPWGRIVAELDHDEPGVLLADIDPQQVTDARERIPALANARDFAAPQALQA